MDKIALEPFFPKRAEADSYSNKLCLAGPKRCLAEMSKYVNRSITIRSFEVQITARGFVEQMPNYRGPSAESVLLNQLLD